MTGSPSNWNSSGPLLEQSRDPAAPLKPLLDMPRPLQGYRDAINRYASQVRPTPLLRADAGPRSRLARGLDLQPPAAHEPAVAHIPARRQRPFSQDDARHLGGVRPPGRVQKHPGRCQGPRLPHALSEMAAHFLEEYLERHWQLLGGPGQRGLVFISTGKPDEVWEYLDSQYAKVTTDCLRFLGCPSIRPHATRYLVGTAILMATQGNVELAAAALHDKKDTVEKHYSKLLTSYASRGVHAAIGRDLSFGFDEKVAGLVPIPYIEPDTKD